MSAESAEFIRQVEAVLNAPDPSKEPLLMWLRRAVEKYRLAEDALGLRRLERDEAREEWDAHRRPVDGLVSYILDGQVKRLDRDVLRSLAERVRSQDSTQRIAMDEARRATERDVANVLREQADRLSDFMDREARRLMFQASELLDGWADEATDPDSETAPGGVGGGSEPPHARWSDVKARRGASAAQVTPAVTSATDTAENVKFGTEGGDVPNLMSATYGAKTATPDLPIEVSDEEGGSYFVPAPLSEAEINRNMKATDLNFSDRPEAKDVHD